MDPGHADGEHAEDQDHQQGGHHGFHLGQVAANGFTNIHVLEELQLHLQASDGRPQFMADVSIEFPVAFNQVMQSVRITVQGVGKSAHLVVGEVFRQPFRLALFAGGVEPCGQVRHGLHHPPGCRHAEHE